MRIRCLIGIHEYVDIKSGPRYVNLDGQIIYDRICTGCGKLDESATRLLNAKKRKF
jgi:hypothetical protein